MTTTGTSGQDSETPRIFAVDPGPTKSGVVLLEAGAVAVARVVPNPEVRVWIKTFGAPGEIVAIELIRSYGMAVGADVFDTCIEIGRFVESAEPLGCIVELIPRQTVKMELCGSARAKDTNIRAALIDAFGGKGAEKKGGALAGVKSHAWAALAVAVTCARQHGWMPR